MEKKTMDHDAPEAAQQAPAPAAEAPGKGLPLGAPIMEAHNAIAMVIGYNELARTAQTLGERIFFRLARDAAEGVAREMGAQIERTEDPERVVVTLSERPRIELRERDLDLMRAALAAPQHPAPQQGTKPPADPAATLARVLARMAYSPDHEMRDLRREVLGMTRSDAVHGTEREQGTEPLTLAALLRTAVQVALTHEPAPVHSILGIAEGAAEDRAIERVQALLTPDNLRSLIDDCQRRLSAGKGT